MKKSKLIALLAICAMSATIAAGCANPFASGGVESSTALASLTSESSSSESGSSVDNESSSTGGEETSSKGDETSSKGEESSTNGNESSSTGGDVTVTTTSIATIRASAAGEYTAKGTVVAINAQGFLLQDETGIILVYEGYSWTCDVAVGDVLTVTGTTSVYANAMQFGKGTTYAKNTTATVTAPTAKVLTATDCDAYKSNASIAPEYVTVTGTLTVKANTKGGYYYNLTIEGAEITGSITYPTTAQHETLSALSGKEITVRGYVTGCSDYYLNILMTEVKEVEDGGGSAVQYMYEDFTAEEKQLFTTYIGEVIPFLPNNEYYVEGYYEETDYENGLCFYTIGSSEDEFAWYKELLVEAGYTYSGTDTNGYGDTWYLFDKDNIMIDAIWYEWEEDGESGTQVDILVAIDDDSGSGGDDDDGNGKDDDTQSEVITLTSKNMGLGNYPSSATSVTVDGTTFSYEMIGDYGNGIQWKKKGDGKLWNTTAIDGGIAAIVLTPNASAYSGTPAYNFTLQLGTTTACTDDEITVEKTSSDALVFTVDGSYTYFKLTNNGSAQYFSSIEIYCGSYDGSTGGGSTTDEDLITNGGKGLPTGENGVYNIDFTKATYAKNVTWLADYKDGCPTTGNVKVLVIPVQFSDKIAPNNYSLDTLKNAFNGTNGKTDYYSVAEYYKKSSYEKLNLEFVVMEEWFTASKTSSYYINYETYVDGYQLSIGDQVVMNEALAYWSKTIDLSQFDSDGNKIIDAVVLVNTLDIDYDVDMQWAYRYWNYYTDDDGYYYEYNNVSANDYLWASYQFLFEDENGGFTDTDAVNTYTFIHEFGHVLGADDYYDTSYSDENSSGPMDGYDVMDMATADHCAYTKFNYGWLTTSRLVVAETSVTLELEAFSKAGDTIIIANNWDDDLGVYQEYFIVTYYTNDGLNSGNGFGLFEKEGIVVYHVNASLYSLEYGEETYYNIYNTNTDASDEDYGTENNLIELVSATSGYVFGVNDSLSASVKDDSGNKIAYVFTVNSLENGTATITFTKNA